MDCFNHLAQLWRAQLGEIKERGELNEELSRKVRVKCGVITYHNLDAVITYPRGRDVVWALYHVKG